MDVSIDFKRLNMVQDHLDRIVKDRACAGCSCLIIKDGKELGYYESGMRDIENNLPITRDTIFRMFSMSKPVASVAAMKLIEDGKIDLLDPVSMYLDGFRNQKCYENGRLVDVKNEVSIKNLLDMTSGICYPGNDLEAEKDTEAFAKNIESRMKKGEKITTVAFANELGKVPLAFEPGTIWNYGFSADVLGAVIEIVSGMTYSEFLKKNIFNPLDMNDTGFYVEESKQSRLARTYFASDLKEYTGDYLLIQSRMKDEPEFESAGAGLVSTIDDYSKICMMLLNNGEYKGRRILHPETVRFMTAGSLTDNQVLGVRNWISLAGHTYGNLLRVMKNPGEAFGLCSKGEYGWDGWTGVYMTNIPEHNMCVLYMMQRYDSGTIDVTRRLRNIIFSAMR